MHLIKILLASVIVALAQGSNSSQFRNWQSSWILGGITPAPKEIRYMVNLRNSDNMLYICGGSILKNWYILTAAHCVYGATSSIIVVTIRRLRMIPDASKFGVSQIIPQPDYDPLTQEHDIAVVKVDRRIPFNILTRPVSLTYRGVITPPGALCTFAGWGKTSASAPHYSTYLKKIQLKIISNTECLRRYLFLPVNYICAEAGPRMGTCKGDGGGPLIYEDNLLGVYIGGGPPGTVCTTLFPSVFVSVVNYIDWIASVII